MAERVFVAALSDNRYSEEEKIALYYDVTKWGSNGVFEIHMRRHIIESDEPLDIKSCNKESHQSSHQPMHQQDEFLKPSHRLKLAFYLNDIKMASDVMDAVLQDGHTTVEDKVKLLALSGDSNISHQLVRIV